MVIPDILGQSGAGNPTVGYRTLREKLMSRQSNLLAIFLAPLRQWCWVLFYSSQRGRRWRLLALVRVRLQTPKPSV